MIVRIIKEYGGRCLNSSAILCWAFLVLLDFGLGGKFVVPFREETLQPFIQERFGEWVPVVDFGLGMVSLFVLMAMFIAGIGLLGVGLSSPWTPETPKRDRTRKSKRHKDKGNLRDECYDALRVPNYQEKDMLHGAIWAIKEQNEGWELGFWFFFGLSVVFFLLGLRGVEDRICWFLAAGSLWLSLTFGSMWLRSRRVIERIRAGEFEVAVGQCLRSEKRSLRSGSYFAVYGAIEKTEKANIVFHVDADVIKVMPEDGWYFWLVSCGKLDEVIICAPRDRFFAATGIEAGKPKWWQPYADDGLDD